MATRPGTDFSATMARTCSLVPPGFGPGYRNTGRFKNGSRARPRRYELNAFNLAWNHIRGHQSRGRGTGDDDQIELRQPLRKLDQALFGLTFQAKSGVVNGDAALPGEGLHQPRLVGRGPGHDENGVVADHVRFKLPVRQWPMGKDRVENGRAENGRVENGGPEKQEPVTE